MPEMPLLQMGRFQHFWPPLPVDTAGGNDMANHDPLLYCNMLDQATQACLVEQERKAFLDEICLEGTLGLRQGFKKFLFGSSRFGWYNGNADSDNDGVSDQEEESNSIRKHCIWDFSHRFLDDRSPEYLHGHECKEDSDCKSQTGDKSRTGNCSLSFRSYCPSPCDFLRYDVKSQGMYTLGKQAVKLIAAQELAWTTQERTLATGTGTKP